MIWRGCNVPTKPSVELTLNFLGSVFHRIVFRDNGSTDFPLLLLDSEIISRNNCTVYESSIFPRALNIASTHINSITEDPELISLPFGTTHKLDQSGLAQFHSPDEYPTIVKLARVYEDLAIHDKWEFGREAILRLAQRTDMHGDPLTGNYSNLSLFLNQMGTTPDAKAKVREGMKDLFDRFVDFDVVITNGTVQLSLIEEIQGVRRSIPAPKLSDGTLRYLCLMAILYNPTPPPVVCIEEPELGLHPDIVVRLAKHLQAASEHMQLIVTTHSDILVDALSDVPESIVVFDNDNGSTQMNRLDRDEMSAWLDDYRLGQLWTSGQIGGTRW